MHFREWAGAVMCGAPASAASRAGVDHLARVVGASRVLVVASRAVGVVGAAVSRAVGVVVVAASVVAGVVEAAASVVAGVVEAAAVAVDAGAAGVNAAGAYCHRHSL